MTTITLILWATIIAYITFVTLIIGSFVDEKTIPMWQFLELNGVSPDDSLFLSRKIEKKDFISFFYKDIFIENYYGHPIIKKLK